MADPKIRIRVLGKESVVDAAKLDSLLASDSQGLIEIVGPDGEEGKVDSVYINLDERPVREQLTAEQLRNRKAVGETNIVFGAGDPKLDMVRRQDQLELESNTARDYAGLAAIRPFVPLIQKAENAAIGEEDANYYRSQLLSTTPGSLLNLAGNIGSFFFYRSVLTKAIPALAFSSRTSMVGQTSQLLSENVALDTQLYANHILNYDKPFSIEDWSQQVATGIVLTAPFMLMRPVRDLAWWGTKKTLGAVSDVVGGFTGKSTVAGVVDLGRDALVAGGLLKGGVAAGLLHRKAAVLGVIGRRIKGWGRKGRVGRVVHDPMSVIDNEIDDLGRTVNELETFNPKSLKGRSTAQRKFMVQRIRELSGEELPFLDDMDFKQVVTDINTGNASIRGVGKTLRGLNLKAKTAANLEAIVDEAIYNVKIDDAVTRLETAGYGDILGQLDNTLHLHDKSGTISFGEWTRARFDARLGKASMTPGATVADSEIRKIVQDPDLWGPKVAARGKVINEAIDNILDNYEILDNFARTNLKEFESITKDDVTALNGIDASLNEIRKGYAALRHQGVFNTEKVRALENKLGDVQRNVAKAKAQYLNASKINRARESAQTMLEKKIENLKIVRQKSPEELKALYEETAIEEGMSLATFKEFTESLFRGIQHPAVVQVPSFGVLALRSFTDEDERRQLFDVVRTNVQGMVGNPEALASQLNMATSGLAQQEPILAQLIDQKSSAILMHLASVMPKEDLTYQGQATPLHISVVDKYLEDFMASYEPLSVGIAASLGLATPSMVRTIKITAPATYAQMYSVMAESLDTLTPAQRLKIPDLTMHGVNVFMGGLSPQYFGYNLVQLQSTYAQTSSEEQVLRGQGKTGSTLKSPGPQQPGSDYTFSQRISGF